VGDKLHAKVMLMVALWSIAFWFLTAVHLFGCLRNDRLRVATKPLLMLTLLALYLSGGHIGATMVLAIVMSLVGDVLLVRTIDPWLTLGGVAFLLAHVAYIWTFGTDIVLSAIPWFVWLAVPIYAAATVLLYHGVSSKLGKKKPPAVIYLVLLNVTGIAALLRWASLGTGFAAITWLGTIAFLISDFTLLIDQFRRPWRHGNFIIMLTYCLAQFLIVASVALA